MIRKFNFDYDSENDSLFIYDPKSKAKASIEIDNLIIDYNNKKEITGIELLNSSDFLKDINESKINKESLNNITECKVEIIPKGSFTMIKLILLFKSTESITAPVFIPQINESSPAIGAL